jgi:DNA-binding ferritin-like protein
METIRKKDLLSFKNNNLISEQKSEGKDFKDMISLLLHSVNQVHIFHWQTKSASSFAEHSALGDYYDEVNDLVDELVESYQGKYGIIENYTCPGMTNYKGTEQLISYFEKLAEFIQNKRESVKESYIQNQIDTVEQLIYKTLYKLKFLK